MSYHALILRGPREQQMDAELFLQDAGVDSYEVISADALENLKDDAFIWDDVDESVLDVDQEVFELRAYFEDLTLLEAIKQAATKQGFQVEEEVVADQDWANDWKKYFHPIRIDSALSIVPSWEDYKAREGETVITLDPGMAFGSGSHATTYLCSKYLRDYLKRGDVVIDIGCGSGILSLVAVASGADSVIAVDMDPQCILATRENAKKNGMLDAIDIREGDLFSVVDGVADLVVSNIFAEVIIGMLEDVKGHIKEGGIYIASGILKEKLPEVEAALIENGFEPIASEVDGDWAAIASRRDH